MQIGGTTLRAISKQVRHPLASLRILVTWSQLLGAVEGSIARLSRIWTFYLHIESPDVLGLSSDKIERYIEAWCDSRHGSCHGIPQSLHGSAVYGWLLAIAYLKNNPQHKNILKQKASCMALEPNALQLMYH